MDDNHILIIGSKGQLGTALKEKYPKARAVDADELDITSDEAVKDYDFSGIDVILNAAAYTNVDGAETDEGRKTAWAVNANAVSRLSTVAQQRDITIVHISTEYVFDGSTSPHLEDEGFSPLNVYGASKAAGDIAVSSVLKHYIVRTSWVMGQGKNFVRTMLGVDKLSSTLKVVADQDGRPTFVVELVRAIDHLLQTQSPFGIYNVSNGGKIVSWASLTREIFKNASINLEVLDITAKEYFANKEHAAARPAHSALSLDKIHSTGFDSHDWEDDLKSYIEKEAQS
jgi:dTDP-4-dehydrorhamnose reductase